ncbi:U4/U6 small nuclear ribonucleoprotein Prp31 homolog isoform X3 [Daucus carota subsp. sativus]|uniref:U4/U6 small nuclear ribonucleoprotein Prp31 homolog isoform X3 n=1 Tax=Daucus carota subsp. sativus TaxID=79200 RepID=UPI0007F03ED9|nr:PREDICTED: U4/U6 small nuclear ribonucleoprotein Prp31-like isoform X3 [Daucus carota subsp. sativus]XP_017220749.1 PREDICTED: U4/U6 small nuclear ribonucleoprotein Prp31-like isoform X3 [Daucus carota subsp. sativus]
MAPIEIDVFRFGSDDEVTELPESQLNIEFIKQRVEDFLEIHHVPSRGLDLTSEGLIFDAIHFLMKIENELYVMFRRHFSGPESVVKKTVTDWINEEHHDESFDHVLELVSLRKRLVDLVDGWVVYSAPNLSALVGTLVAGKIMVTAGGLGFLAKMPSCNIQLLGFQNIFLDGLPAKFTLGYLQESEILQTFPSAVTRGAALVLAANCRTAARFDFMETDPSGSTGKHLREVVLNKLRRYEKRLLPGLGELDQSTPPGNVCLQR